MTIDPGTRILACSDKHAPILGRFEKTARNGYSWISLPVGNETGMYLWPTTQIRKAPHPDEFHEVDAA